MKSKTKNKTKPRDNNVRMLYHLENTSLPVGRRFSDTKQIQEFVDYITASNFWHVAKMRDPELPGSLRVFSLGDKAYSEQVYPNEIWMAIKHWDQQVVLHEVAHFFADNHTPKFVRAYLDLITQFMGLEFAAEYRRAFRLGKIKF